jgi:hypothetical protein
VQVVLDALEGDLVTKNDFALFQEKLENRFVQVHSQIKESELRMTTRLGFMMVSTVSIAVAVLTWLIKLR